MDKRYQVFVSSTYADLKDERSKVIQTLMEMDCIPAGMELFPAADEEQWEFIKKVIDDCDYYLLIIGGRYGSTDSAGLSYTEKEYDYAVKKGLKVIALLHLNPEDLPGTKIEPNPEFKSKLKSFRDKAAKGRLVKFWTKPDELPGIVALSLSKTIKMYPATGWVRADKVSNVELLNEVNGIRKENNNLKELLSKYKDETIPKIQNLADLEESVLIRGQSEDYQGSDNFWSSTVKWKDIFAIISPYLMNTYEERDVKFSLAKELCKLKNQIRYYMSDDSFHTIKIQFKALELVIFQRIIYNDTTEGCLWSLSPKGNKLMMEIRTIKSDKPR